MGALFAFILVWIAIGIGLTPVRRYLGSRRAFATVIWPYHLAVLFGWIKPSPSGQKE